MAGTKAILSMRQWCYLELGDEKAVEFVAMATPEVIDGLVWWVDGLMDWLRGYWVVDRLMGGWVG